MNAVNKPRNITYKGVTDLVTDTDKKSEATILEVLRKNFEDHLILGEEGGITGDASSDYMWCIDPLDGTTNFAHGYPSFAVSVGVLFQGKPVAAAVYSPSVDMCHVALGIVEVYWEYRLKPWDMAAGVLIVEEAGGKVTCMDGGKFSVFDRSVLESNGVLHAKLLERIEPATEKLKTKEIDFSLWYKPEDYTTDI